MSKVLFITEKVSFISEGIINHLKAQDFEVLTVKPDVTAISNFTTKTPLIQKLLPC